jgi:DNA-binding NarL/FixJ family response regulator
METPVRMDEQNISFSFSRYLAQGYPGNILNVLVESLYRNSIPFQIIENRASRNGVSPAGSLVLYDPIWGKVGLIELQQVDHTQTLVLFCLPEYPDNREIEKYEEKIRESLPASAIAIHIFDFDNAREKALSYLGKYLHEYRLRCLQEINNLLATSPKLVSLQGLIFDRLQHDEPWRSPKESQRQTTEKVDRDIPTENEPIRSDLQELVQLWQSGYTAKEIALRIGKTEKTILNRLTLLRRSHGEQVVPRRKFGKEKSG